MFANNLENFFYCYKGFCCMFVYILPVFKFLELISKYNKVQAIFLTIIKILTYLLSRKIIETLLWKRIRNFKEIFKKVQNMYASIKCKSCLRNVRRRCINGYGNTSFGLSIEVSVITYNEGDQISTHFH